MGTIYRQWKLEKSRVVLNDFANADNFRVYPGLGYDLFINHLMPLLDRLRVWNKMLLTELIVFSIDSILINKITVTSCLFFKPSSF
jgi:hypothetical protein